MSKWTFWLRKRVCLNVNRERNKQPAKDFCRLFLYSFVELFCICRIAVTKAQTFAEILDFCIWKNL